jgi:hypothetical protein
MKDCRKRLCDVTQAVIREKNCSVWPAVVLAQTPNVYGGIYCQFLCCWHWCIVDGRWHRAVLQIGTATPTWRQLEVFPTCISTLYDVILKAPLSSSSSALRPWVGLSLLQQMSLGTATLDTRPPISTTQSARTFLYPVNPSYLSATSSLTSSL